MQSKKRIAPGYKFGNFSFSGGTETRFVGKDFNGMTFVTAFRYAVQGQSYDVNIFGRKVKFKMDINHLTADVTLDPKGVKFKVNLTFGQ